MYYKYFTDIKICDKIKEYVLGFIKCLIYGVVLTLIIGYIIGFRPIYIIGDSMTPTIMKYDLILIKPVDKENIHVDDVITYTTGGKTRTTHRIFAADSDYFYTIDEPTYLKAKKAGRELIAGEDGEEIPYKYVVGKVIHILPITGDLIDYFTIFQSGKTTLDFSSIFEALLTMLAIWQLFVLFKRDDIYDATAKK